MEVAGRTRTKNVPDKPARVPASRTGLWGVEARGARLDGGKREVALPGRPAATALRPPQWKLPQAASSASSASSTVSLVAARKMEQSGSDIASSAVDSSLPDFVLAQVTENGLLNSQSYYLAHRAFSIDTLDRGVNDIHYIAVITIKCLVVLDTICHH